MAKIIKIQEQLVIIGRDDSSTIEIPKTDFNFEIYESMLIDVHKHGDKYIISKSTSPQGILQGQAEEPHVQGKKYVNKVAYGVLRLLLGIFGIHHFYAGNILKGIATLLTIPVSIILLAIGIALCKFSPLLGLPIAIVFGFICIFFHLYLFITAIIVLCQQANANGNILIKGGR